MPNIVAMDNGTMVEAFQFLNYCQLATSSHVSKRFWNLIRTHRHKLALLDVGHISLEGKQNKDPVLIRMFNEELTAEEYNEWIVRNGYSKQIPLEGQIAENESTENGHAFYVLQADIYQNPNHHLDITTVFKAQVELKDETWPLFQHFVRLLMDPFINIRTLSLNPPKNVFSFLARAMNPDRNRLQCKKLNVEFNDDTQKFIVWIKDHMRCDELSIDENNDEELLDLFLTGASCTSAIDVTEWYEIPPKVIVDFVQKFNGFENLDEYKVVESILGDFIYFEKVVDELKRNFAEFITEEEQFQDGYHPMKRVIVFEFINNDIAKKLTLYVEIHDPAFFTIKITNS